MTSDSDSGEQSERDALLESVAEGDRTIIARLTAQYLPEIQGFLHREMGPVVAAKESSEDLAQSVCREALQGLAEGRVAYQGEPAFRQWLYQAAKHKVLHRHRHWQTEKRDAKREQAWAEPEAALSGALRDEATPSLEVARRETQDRVLQLLDQLPDREQQIVRLAHLEGLDHATIAAQLDLTPNHTRVLLSRALARIASLAARSGSPPTPEDA